MSSTRSRIATWVVAAVLALAALIALAWPHTSESETTAKHDDVELRDELMQHRDALRELVDESKQLEAAEEKLLEAERGHDSKSLDETRRMRRALEKQLRDIERELDGK